MCTICGAVGNGGSAGRSQGTNGFVAQKDEALRRSAGLFGVLTSLVRVDDFGTPVDVDEERASVDRLLGGGTPTATSHVTGGHGHHMGGHTHLGQGLDDSDWPQQVDLDGLVQW